MSTKAERLKNEGASATMRIQNIKLDSRKRVGLNSYFPEASEVRVTQVTPDRIIVEPVISYTPAEIRAMRDPDIIAAEQRFFTQSELPEAIPLKQIREERNKVVKQ